jgi:hypothetical protein
MWDENSPERLSPISAIIQLSLPFGLVFRSNSVAEALICRLITDVGLTTIPFFELRKWRTGSARRLAGRTAQLSKRAPLKCQLTSRFICKGCIRRELAAGETPRAPSAAGFNWKPETGNVI